MIVEIGVAFVAGVLVGRFSKKPPVGVSLPTPTLAPDEIAHLAMPVTPPEPVIEPIVEPVAEPVVEPVEPEPEPIAQLQPENVPHGHIWLHDGKFRLVMTTEDGRRARQMFERGLPGPNEYLELFHGPDCRGRKTENDQ